MSKTYRNIAIIIIGLSLTAAFIDGSSPYQKAVDEITTAYVMKVNIPGRAVVCDHKELQARQFIFCKLKSLDGEANLGVWEVVGKDNPLFYALNGKAITALDTLSLGANFLRHPSPAKLDISAIIEDFAGANKPVIFK
jgi:hypothetical protein